MRIYLGFDDTDVLGAPIGTGRLVRLFARRLPAGARLWGVLRQQLLLDDTIPYTSHNSSACAVVEVADASLREALTAEAVAHLAEYASPGSDPGLCVAQSDGEPSDGDLGPLQEFGLACTHAVQTQAAAYRAAEAAGATLLGLGGTEDGVIGAVAAVGLTVWGWAGRFLEYNDLRALPATPRIADLEAAGIRPMPIENEVCVLPGDTPVITRGWISPRLWGGAAVLPLRRGGDGWQAVGKRPRDAEVAE